jgi:protein-S-isoprenylcysteine O-methyltransferase Ste14
MIRLLAVTYGLVAYVLFLATFGYTVGFLAGVGVPKGIDDGPAGPAWLALAVDAALLGLFAVAHSVMARPWFKRAWTRVVPATVERSTYVLVSTLLILLLEWQWRPLPTAVWSVDTGWLRVGLWALYASGWVLVVVSTFAISHLDFFGLRQVLAVSYTRPGFRAPFLYRLVRHPLLVGFLIAFWAAPDMSVGRLLFTGLSTGYILVAVRLEEADLRRDLGEPYERYSREVPRFIPRLGGVSARTPSHSTR